MKVKSLLVIAAMAVSTSAFSQEFNFGLKAGANLNTASIKSDGEKIDDIDMKPGLLLGGYADINLAETFAMEIGLQFEQKGLKYEESESGYSIKTEMNVNYITIPVDFKINVPVNDNKFYLLAGPTAGIGVSGKIKSEAKVNGVKVSDDESIEFGEDEDSDLRRINFGLDLGAGFVLANNLGFRIGYNLGLSNLVPKGDSDNSAKFSSVNLAITYRF